MPRDPTPLPEFFGDTMCVNGAVGPFMTVEPRLCRFRIINGCNARFINLDWKPSSLTGARPPMHVIGSDGGLLPKATTTPTLVIAPGERYDILVDFSAFAGERINLANRTPFPAPVVNPASPLPRVMQFLVTAVEQGEPARRDVQPRSDPDDRHARHRPQRARCRRHALPLLRGGDGQGRAARRRHQRQDVRPFIPVGAVGAPVLPSEMGWKDTVQMHPGEVTRIRAKFDIRGFSTPQDYVFHCHILEHETNSMMRPYRVVA